MASTKFSRRFKELVAGMSDTELGFVLGVSAAAAGKMRNGDIKSLKLQAALRLAKELQISLWYLGGEPEPDAPSTAESTRRDRKLPKHGTSRGGPERGSAASERTIRDDMTELRARVARLESTVKKISGDARPFPRQR